MASTPAPAASVPASQMTPQQINYAARMALLPRRGNQTVRRLQPINTFTSANYVAGQQLQLIINPQPTGIITRFLVRVTASVGIGNAETQTRVQNGANAFFSNIQYVDTSLQTRINTPMWHLNQVNSLRRRGIFGAARTNDINTVVGMGAAYTGKLIAAPASLTGAPPANGSPNFFSYVEIPLAYAKDDLTGAVYSNMVGATQQLILTVNPNFFCTSTDVVNVAEAAYQSSSAQLGLISYLTITVYQEYIDQIGGLALPMIDLTTQYQMQVSSGWSAVANQDLLVQYPNYRRFMSTIVRYNNAGTFNIGSDISYFAIRTSNQSDMIHEDPLSLTLDNRSEIFNDLPAGYYFINHREKPLYTNTAGALNFVVQPSAVTGANSIFTLAYESLQQANQLPAATSIMTGG